jgi:undecaprenyl pyrophosphate phosphatase UppP
MQTGKAINLIAAFFLEIAMLIFLGYCGFQYPENRILKYLLMILLPLIAAILWGFFAAPKSRRRLRQPYRMFFAMMIFGVAVFLLYKSGIRTLAIVFAVLVLINQLLLLILKQ